MSIKEKPKAIVRQTPHCEGQEINRRLFNKYEPDADHSFILAKREPSRIILEAGAAQGITIDSRMTFHAYNFLETAETPNPCLGYLTVKKADHFSSVLEVLEVPSDTERFPLPPLFYCLIESLASEKIALYCEDRVWLESVFPPEERNQSITIVNDVTDCDLQLNVMDEKVHFARHHDLVTPHIGTHIIHTVNVDNKPAIRNVVKGSFNFYYHLTRQGKRLSQVSMELTKLLEKEDPSDDFGVILTPTGENLIVNDPARIAVDDARFGMKIINRSNRPLYPYLFYFDPTDLTIGMLMFAFHQLNLSTNPFQISGTCRLWGLGQES